METNRDRPRIISPTAYDARGRLTIARTPAGSTIYRINALGQRVMKGFAKTGTAATATVNTYYHYDPDGHLIAESDATGRVTRETLWLGDTPMAVMQ